MLPRTDWVGAPKLSLPTGAGHTRHASGWIGVISFLLVPPFSRPKWPHGCSVGFPEVESMASLPWALNVGETYRQVSGEVET